MPLYLTPEQAAYLRVVLAADIDRIADNIGDVHSDHLQAWKSESCLAHAILALLPR